MKRFLSICLFVVLSILLAPIVSDHYRANAGRLINGNIVDGYCDCNVPGEPCYYDDRLERCNTDGNAAIASKPTDGSTTDLAPKGDLTSAGLMLFATIYLFRRFIL